MRCWEDEGRGGAQRRSPNPLALPRPSPQFEDPPLHDPCAVAYVIAPHLFKVPAPCVTGAAGGADELLPRCAALLPPLLDGSCHVLPANSHALPSPGIDTLRAPAGGAPACRCGDGICPVVGADCGGHLAPERAGEELRRVHGGARRRRRLEPEAVQGVLGAFAAVRWPPTQRTATHVMQAMDVPEVLGLGGRLHSRRRPGVAAQPRRRSSSSCAGGVAAPSAAGVTLPGWIVAACKLAPDLQMGAAARGRRQVWHGAMGAQGETSKGSSISANVVGCLGGQMFGKVAASLPVWKE